MMNNYNNSDSDTQHKSRIKSARFNDEDIATVIPSSKSYKHDSEDHSRKDAVEEFQSKRGTYGAAIVIGVLVFIVGCVLIWVGSHYDLRDFFVLGPLVLCIGLGIACGGIVFLCLSIRKSKQANTRIGNGNIPSRLVDTPNKMLSDQSFVTTSDVTMDMAGVSRPGTVDLYGSQERILEEPEQSFVLAESPKPEELYSAHVTPEVTEAVIVKRTSTPSGVSREHRVNTPEGEVFVVSLPNQTLRSDGDGSSYKESIGDGESDDTVPKPAFYLEPEVNQDSVITTL